ncbi:izumo sperm-egg fusion protein 1 isoform X1 [Nothobranchius furzeri]|uniref:Transcript variant X1 n=2 Tax=Nothobranchius furzeri TaxID=105023 RepID=A0A9D2XE68_NOTFU|nr:transcript variant X1 [Nothobranchius furzeri]
MICIFIAPSQGSTTPQGILLADIREKMLLMLVTLFCAPVTKACLQCDSTITRMHEDFILSAPSVNDQIELQTICDYAYVTYKETSQAQKGVIDSTTLYRARTEYQSEFNRFLTADHTGSLAFDTIQIMEKGRTILEKHLDTFIPNGLCPNMCGLLHRRVMNCISCQYEMYTCPSPTGQQDCGVFPVEAEEGGQAVLNCFHPWHRLVLENPEYYYSWAPGKPGARELDESDFAALVVTYDSFAVLNQLHLDEQGTYRCSLQDQNGTLFYRVTFLLTVAPLPHQTHQTPVTLPLLPPGDDDPPLQPTEELLVALIAMVTALTLTASVGLTVALGMMKNRQQAASKAGRRKNAQNTV